MHPKKPVKVKLICGIMYSDYDIYKRVKKILIRNFGNIDFISEEYSFSGFTNYYEKEMGNEINKVMVSFEKPVDRDKLSKIKLITNKIEDKLSFSGNRVVNLDPGYLTLHNVVLASAKEMPHKVSIGRGMFGDVVLTFRNGEYNEYFRTFPDFKGEKIKDILLRIRDIYKGQMKNENS